MRSPTGRRAVACAAVLTVLSTLGGCGGDGVPPAEWASTVCRALKPWTERIASLTQDAQTQMSKATSPRQAKESILGLLAGAERASEHARQRVADAGVPAVDDGERIATEFQAALSAARDAYGSARGRVERIETDSADDFYDRVVEAMERLSTDYDNGALDTSELESEELQRAFDESPGCR
jgi:predicted small lipoprotein YifL